MADWIDSKRFAERWPFAGALVLIAATALALKWQSASVSKDALDFCVGMLYCIWVALLGTRLHGIGILPKTWQRLLLGMAVVVPVDFAYYHLDYSGPCAAAAIFLAIQIPLVVMQSKAPTSATIPQEEVIAPPAGSSSERSKRIKNPFPDGTPEAASYLRHQRIWAQFLFICIAIAVAYLVFRKDFYGFFLPGVCFTMWLTWIGSVREKQRQLSREQTDLSCGES